jgi:O-antigen ligase
MKRSFPDKLRSLLNRHSLAFWVLMAFLALIALLGGSSRSDPQSMTLMRPAAVLFFAFGLYTVQWKNVAAFRFLFAFALACFGIVLLYVIPLPPALHRVVHAGSLAADIEVVAKLPQGWRPISVVPAAGWNALLSLFVPLTVLLLASQLHRQDRSGLLKAFLLLGVANTVLALLQAIGPSGSGFYLYQITNGNVPVGFFANRNHFAVFLSCLFPMLAIYCSANKASNDVTRLRRWLAVAFCALLIPLILVTGSRAGLLTALLSILATPLLYRADLNVRPGKRETSRVGANYLVGGFGVAAMAVITLLAARAETFSRILDDGGSSEMRFSIWSPILKMAQSYLPLGSGAGSFSTAYQIGEPVDTLTFQYVPHAHNDWLEVLLTTGLPGALLVLVSVAAILFVAWRDFRADKFKSRDVIFGRLGVVILGLLGIASIADYPLRVPSIMCLMTVAAIWAAASHNQPSKNTGSA